MSSVEMDKLHAFIRNHIKSEDADFPGVFRDG